MAANYKFFWILKLAWLTSFWADNSKAFLLSNESIEANLNAYKRIFLAAIFVKGLCYSDSVNVLLTQCNLVST